MNTNELIGDLLHDLRTFGLIAFPNDANTQATLLRCLTVTATYRHGMRRHTGEVGAPDEDARWEVTIKHPVIFANILAAGDGVSGYAGSESGACDRALERFEAVLRKYVLQHGDMATSHHRLALGAAAMVGDDVGVPTLKGNAPGS